MSPDAPGGDPGPVAIRPRNVRFDLHGIPLQWIPGHPVASNFISALNLILPEGERWFVEAFEEALPLVDDEELRESMRGFIGQEAMHSNVHDGVLWGYLRDQGIDATPYQRQVEWIFRAVLGPRQGLSRRRRRKRLIARLWLIAAVEHFTAVFGDFALNSRWDEAGAAPALCDLYRWHGAEEVEHRSVAHDVATYFGDSYFRRVWAMAAAFPLLMSLLVRGTHFINHHDQSAPTSEVALWRQGYADSRAGLLPGFAHFGGSLVAYLRRDYDPADIGSTAQAVAYLASSPASRMAM
ncbi:metal-dependent hydrolase [Gordonia sp. PKS22-38]|uniref:Metal-dependent hydrolase n=1 Tax=Gordonia prachuapensis TaxID=3115651 RepID=A0ABU7MZK7_9ACTN|nr:metal-dependent hydrolase [Gordonia sp. PKS22-38]